MQTSQEGTIQQLTEALKTGDLHFYQDIILGLLYQMQSEDPRQIYVVTVSKTPKRTSLVVVMKDQP